MHDARAPDTRAPPRRLAPFLSLPNRETDREFGRKKEAERRKNCRETHVRTRLREGGVEGGVKRKGGEKIERSGN